MISTVTTSAVNIVLSSVLAPLLPTITIALVIVFLVQKEIASTLDTPQAQQLSRALNIVLVPLLVASAFIAIFGLIQVLR